MPGRKSSKARTQGAVDTAFNNTDSGPAAPPAPDTGSPAMKRAAAVAATAQAQPQHANKADEYGEAGALSLPGRPGCAAG